MPVLPRHWASLSPWGLGHRKPSHYTQLLRRGWENRDELRFAWRILRDGVCDGCSLGTSGMRDWTAPGVHLCDVRLDLLRLNTAPALDPDRLEDVRALKTLDPAALRRLGRIPYPMLRQRGEGGYRVITWDEAIGLIAAQLKETAPARAAFYLTARGTTNEVFYAAQKSARFFGTNNVDTSARLCQAASTIALQSMLGHGAATCSYTDWLAADLVVFFGSNAPSNQPVTAKYLHRAKRNGTRVAVVNPLREEGWRRYWVPSILESAAFGTRLADDWFQVHTGGDLAFLVGVFRALVEAGEIDRQAADRAVGFEAASEAVLATAWSQLEAESGLTQSEITRFARLLVEHPRAVFVWSVGLTQHAHGVDTIKALVNVALARGLLGRAGAGLMPIGGQSGAPAGAELGCTPDIAPEVAAHWSRVWGFPVPTARGLTVRDMINAAARGDLDVFWVVGGSFLETLPGRDRSRAALHRPRLRIHQDIVLNESMLVSPSHDVLILPACTRYETPGGTTETTTERRIVFSPEIPGRRIAAARPEWWVFGEVMAQVRPEAAEIIRFWDARAIRSDIAQAFPAYEGVQDLRAKGDQVQWGGQVLYADGRFATPDGRARFALVRPLGRAGDGERLRLSARRGRQFNSMARAACDPVTGARRDDVLMSAEDARRHGMKAGERVRLVSEHGAFEGRIRLALIKPGNLEVHWPEANALLSADRADPQSNQPDYNVDVWIEKP